MLVLYVWLASPYIVYGDNAELSGLGAIGGVPHPSGYPLYVLWLRAWSWLPGTPAHTAAIATAILTALEVLVLHAACRAWGARPLAASAAVVLFAASPVVLRVQSEAEVFALNGLAVGAVAWLAAPDGPVRGHWRTALLGLAAGLGMSNHLTCVLIAPLGVWGAWRGVREDERGAVRGVALGVGGLVLGLAPYAYLFVAPNSWMSWRSVDSVHDLVRHVLRYDYGGPGQFSPVGAADASVADNLVTWTATLGRAYLWLPAALGVGALGYFTARGTARVAWGTLAASWLVAGPLLVLRFNVQPEGVGLYVVQRFHIMSLTLLAIPVAVALDRLVAWRFSERPAPSPLAHGLLVIAGLAMAAGPGLPYVARMHSPAIEQSVHNELASLPENAIVIGSFDLFHFGLSYVQGALGERRDVGAITTIQLGLDSAREKVRARTGIEVPFIPRGSEEKLSVKVAELALATGRPVFIDPFQANIAAAFPTYPYGLLFRVLPKGTTPPPVREVFEINKRIYGAYVFGYAFPGVHDQLAADIHTLYARTWKLLAPALADAHLDDELAFARAMIAELSPQD